MNRTTQPFPGRDTRKETSWSREESLRLYRLADWGLGFFGINPEGRLTVAPFQEQGPDLDLMALVNELVAGGLRLPVLIRFSDILRHRIESLHRCFAESCLQHGYQGRYRGVYPIKVNQRRQVVEEIIALGKPFGMGLEVGSKPELQIALALSEPDGPIICNGFKDDAYLRLALLSRRAGWPCHVVVENLDELDRVARWSKELAVAPWIGLRFRPESEGAGHWRDSAGGAARFGLTATEMVAAVAWLAESGGLPWVRLLHFHLGSQISDIGSLKRGLEEGARMMAALFRMGCSPRLVDVGGGLGVDYDGSRSGGEASVNYSMREYVANVVFYLATVCQEQGLPHPDILSESGRALTAHHAVLVTSVVSGDAPDWLAQEGGGSRVPGATPYPAGGDNPPQTPLKMDGNLVFPVCEPSGRPDVVGQLRRLGESISHENRLKVWHNALEWRERGRQLFAMGWMSLPQRAAGEYWFERIVQAVSAGLEAWRGGGSDEGWVCGLRAHAVVKYYGNFSLFRSLPDHWAIQQLFPVVPLQRLTEYPAVATTLQDLTCDSDGRIARFVGEGEGRSWLPLHRLRPGEPYCLGVFLVGAYQEALGGLHNLFGRVSGVRVTVTGSNRWQVTDVEPGEVAREVLGQMGYQAEELTRRVAIRLAAERDGGRIRAADGEALGAAYAAAMEEYPYFNRAPTHASSTRGTRPGG